MDDTDPEFLPRRRDLHTIQFDALFSHTAPPEISIELHAYCTTKSARRKL